MDEKIFSLLEKVYVELQETKSELQEVKFELQETKKEVKENTEHLGQLEREVTCNNGQIMQLEIRVAQLGSITAELRKDTSNNGDHIILLENAFHDKVGILFDGLEIVQSDVKDLKKTLNKITAKIENHDMRINIAEKKLNLLSC